jgi:hypothetical protein
MVGKIAMDISSAEHLAVVRGDVGLDHLRLRKYHNEMCGDGGHHNERNLRKEPRYRLKHERLLGF